VACTQELRQCGVGSIVNPVESVLNRSFLRDVDGEEPAHLWNSFEKIVVAIESKPAADIVFE
jgi:hypothetical protein